MGRMQSSASKGQETLELQAVQPSSAYTPSGTLVIGKLGTGDATMFSDVNNTVEQDERSKPAAARGKSSTVAAVPQSHQQYKKVDPLPRNQEPYENDIRTVLRSDQSASQQAAVAAEPAGDGDLEQQPDATVALKPQKPRFKQGLGCATGVRVWTDEG